ncbi:ER membrane protein complex subunit 9 isoform X2 [Sciurus carolinensis]|uniref:ER membrane protein complex subunit 9 isoform X2 n=1 Tax=Sciurus carolinensis TaxID=30640 RepID=UPI001FB471E3|nr:ER membrane protein complex subunit 9 isoform X2 [Sciurus carolinensis]
MQSPPPSAARWGRALDLGLLESTRCLPDVSASRSNLTGHRERPTSPAPGGESALIRLTAYQQVPLAMGEVEISARAYVKMCLHAARYPHAAVNGLLLAPAPRAGECLCLTDCVPLFHSHLALSVMLEVALNQVDVWGTQAGLVVAGYYHANAALDDQSPGPLALKIAGRIAEFFPDTVLIMPRVPPVIVLENQSLRWVPKDKNLVMWRDWEESRQMVGALLEGRAHQHLVDFDCHLDDIRQDWTNQQLNTQITQWVGPTNGNA